MAIDIGGKTYRNLPEQVEENSNNIQWLLDTIASFGNVMRYKGSVATYDDLPTEGNAIGDVWNVLDTGNNYAWDGEGWDEISSAVDVSEFVTWTALQAGYYNKNTLDSIMITHHKIVRTTLVLDFLELQNLSNKPFFFNFRSPHDDGHFYIAYFYRVSSSVYNFYIAQVGGTVRISALNEFLYGTSFADIFNTASYRDDYVTENAEQELNNKTLNAPIINRMNPNTSGYGAIIPNTATWTEDKELALKEEVPTNYVTTDTAETISARKTFNAGIAIKATGSGNPLKISGTYLSYDLFITGANVFYIGELRYDSGYNFYNNKHGSLGFTSKFWKNLYLDGFISDGTNQFTAAEVAALKWNSYDITNIDSVTNITIASIFELTVIYFDSGHLLPAGTKEVIVTLTDGTVIKANSVKDAKITLYYDLAVGQADIAAIQYR